VQATGVVADWPWSGAKVEDFAANSIRFMLCHPFAEPTSFLG
jgi:hypothetical protein